MKTKYTFLQITLFIVLVFDSFIAFSQANETLSNLASPTAINQNLLPGSDNNKNLGSSGKSWKNLYLDGDIYIDGNRFTFLPTTTSTFLGNTLNTTSTGVGNSAFGYHVLMANTSGAENSGFAAYALEHNTTGKDLAAFGYAALGSNTTGSYNASTGSFSLYNNTTGSNNAAFGYRALYDNNDGYDNCAFGSEALYSLLGGYRNTAIGRQALYASGINIDNTSVGYQAGHECVGSGNTYIGSEAGQWSTEGSYNCFIGAATGVNNVTGYYNTILGGEAQVSTSALHNATALGYNAFVNTSNKIRLGNSSVTVIEGTVNYTVSDGRFKTNITEEVKGLDFISKLRPVVYNFEAKKFDEFLGSGNTSGNGATSTSLDYSQAENIRYSGFIAQEVEQAAKESGYDFNGVHVPENSQDNYSLAYAEFVVPLVKAVQEQQEIIESQKMEIQTQQNDMAAMKARLDKLEQLTMTSKSSNDEILKSTPSESDQPRLEQNFPNPTDRSTVIGYYLPATSGDAEIRFFSERGEMIKSILLNEKGNGQISLEIRNISAGVCRYSLIVDGAAVDTKQMVITK